MRQTDGIIFLRNRKSLAAVALALFLPLGCEGDESAQTVRRKAMREAIEQQHLPPPSQAGKALLTLVRSLPDDESTHALVDWLPRLLLGIGETTISERPQVYATLALLRDQPNIVEALRTLHAQLPVESFDDKLLSVRVMGELQRPDAFPFFTDIIWAPPGTGDSAAPEHESMLRSSAVRGLAYLRTENGFPLLESATETLRVVRDHSSRSVRIAAINAYMWNHGDADSSARALYEELPEEFHMFVERPRFYRGANREHFEARLEEWNEKWQK